MQKSWPLIKVVLSVDATRYQVCRCASAFVLRERSTTASHEAKRPFSSNSTAAYRTRGNRALHCTVLPPRTIPYRRYLYRLYRTSVVTVTVTFAPVILVPFKKQDGRRRQTGTCYITVQRTMSNGISYAILAYP